MVKVFAFTVEMGAMLKTAFIGTNLLVAFKIYKKSLQEGLWPDQLETNILIWVPKILSPNNFMSRKNTRMLLFFTMLTGKN